jgi:hypothetical protein
MRLDRLRVGAVLEPGREADALVRPVRARAEQLRDHAVVVRVTARLLAARSRLLRAEAREARQAHARGQMRGSVTGQP